MASFRVLSLRAGAVVATAACCAGAAPATPSQARTTSVAQRLGATALSFRCARAGLDEGADLQLGLKQRARGVTQGLGCLRVGRPQRDILWNDDPLEAGDVGQPLPDLVVAPDHGERVLVGVERRR